jgi:hypothetical protein
VLAAGLASIVGLAIWMLVTSAERSFLVEAETGRVELTFELSQTTWDLPDATECAPAPRPGQAHPVCGAAFEPIGGPRTRTIAWPRGARIALAKTRDGDLSVAALESTDPALPVGTRLVVPLETWERMGALAFTARARIGDDMRTGALGYLRSGRWEARESGRVTSALRTVTEVVKQGTFASGAYVEVLHNGVPARTYGHLDRSDAPGTLSVMLISEVGDTALSVRHFGVERPVTIRPDWVDVAISSPILLAATALLTILAAAVQLGWNVCLLWPRKEAQPGAAEARADPIVER